MREYRIIGPPGTGKTTFVARQVEGWRDKYRADEILIASFTRTAAREIASRGVDIAEQNVGTLHSICFRILGKPELAESYKAEWNEWVEPRVPAFKLGGSHAVTTEDPLAIGTTYEDSGAPIPGDLRLAEIQTLRGRLAPRDTWPSQALHFDELWQTWKQDHGLFDFTDLLERCLHEQPTPAGIRIACFDEVQDFAPLELALIRKWREDLDGIALVGDPDQCIYAFKGATPQAFLNPAIPKEDYRILAQSHRIPASVHRIAVDWIKQSSWRYDFAYHPRDFEGRVSHMDGSRWLSLRTPDYVAREAVNHARQGRTVMVLASCAFHLGGVVAELKKQGAPFHNPHQIERGDWNPLRGTADKLKAFLLPLRPDMAGLDTAPRLWRSTEVAKWACDIKSAGTLRHGAKEKIKARASDEAKIRDAEPFRLHDLEFYFEDDAVDRLMRLADTDEPWLWLEERLLPDAQRRFAYALAVARKSGVRALVETPKIVVGTIHSVKGAQADVVMLAPDLSAAGYASWHRCAEGRDSVRRVFYVGMTRAQQELVLLGSMGGKAVQWNR